MLRDIRLYGHLGERFGRSHRLDVQSPAEAVRALHANYPGFCPAILEHGPGYRVWCGTDRRGQQDVRLPGSGVIRIAPVVAGSDGDKGFGQILLGAALVGLSFVPGLQTVTLGAGGSITAASIASSVGTSLILGGVSQLLFAPPRADLEGNERPENRPSYIFNGPVNTTVQGNAVPVGYGQLEIGSQVISAGLFTTRIPA